MTAIICAGAFAQSIKGDQVIEVPFEFIHNQVVIQVKINGKGPFNMLLDTGTDPSAIDLATARDIGLKLGSKGHQGSGGGTDVNPGYETRLPVVEIGARQMPRTSAFQGSDEKVW